MPSKRPNLTIDDGLIQRARAKATGTTVHKLECYICNYKQWIKNFNDYGHEMTDSEYVHNFALYEKSRDDLEKFAISGEF